MVKEKQDSQNWLIHSSTDYVTLINEEDAKSDGLFAGSNSAAVKIFVDLDNFIIGRPLCRFWVTFHDHKRMLNCNWNATSGMSDRGREVSSDAKNDTIRTETNANEMEFSLIGVATKWLHLDSRSGYLWVRNLIDTFEGIDQILAKVEVRNKMIVESAKILAQRPIKINIRRHKLVN